MRKLIAAGALALGCSTGAAQAAPVITFTAGGSGVPTGEALIQGFDGVVGSQVAPGVYIENTSIPGISDRPTGATGNYGAVTANSTYSVNFGQATGVFSFVLGSLDAYNRLVVTYAGGATQTFNGTDIIGGLGSTMSEGLVTYNAGTGPLFTGVSFLSIGQNSFEIDTLAAAVPEPAAWGLMILGFGLVGGVLRRRPSVKVRFA